MFTYNSKQVKIACGSHTVTGYADDSFVTIDPHGDGTQVTVGCDGEVVRSINPDNCYTIKLSLLQDSTSNEYFNNMYVKDQESGDGVFAVTVRDIMGDELFSASSAWVNKPASKGYGKTSTNREWELTAADGKFEY